VNPPGRLAAIDVGSNTILLLIAEYDAASGLKVIDQAEDQPRLGAGLGNTGRLSDQSMERALQTLVRMRDLCRASGVTRLRAVATAAVREAENGREFVRRAREHDIPLETISPEAEAALAYRSASYHFPEVPRVLVADIGGGSLELIGGEDGRVELIRSLPLGAVRLTELALPLPELRDRVRSALAEAVLEQQWAGSQVIGSGGTFATAAAIKQARRGALNQPVQGAEVGREELEDLIRTLSGMSPEQRRRVPGLPPERADVIVAGLVVAAELLDRLDASGVRINQYGLREGLLLEMVASQEVMSRKGRNQDGI
jgi:exopolyphosphatase/guanosine-5'-triphosphate,3'-diphosphate pyrophosphatase